MTSAEHFFTLLAAIVACAAAVCAALVFLMRISIATGRMVERLDTHIKAEDRLNESMDKRVTWLEQRRR